MAKLRQLLVVPMITVMFVVLTIMSSPAAAAPVTTTTTHAAHAHPRPPYKPLVLRTHYTFGEVSNSVIRLQRFMHFQPQDGLYGLAVRTREYQSLKNYHMREAWLPNVPGWYYSWRDATHPCEEPTWNQPGDVGGLGWTGASFSLAKHDARLQLAPGDASSATVDEQIIGGEALNGRPPWTTVGSCYGYTGW